MPLDFDNVVFFSVPKGRTVREMTLPWHNVALLHVYGKMQYRILEGIAASKESSMKIVLFPFPKNTYIPYELEQRWGTHRHIHPQRALGWKDKINEKKQLRGIRHQQKI